MTLEVLDERHLEEPDEDCRLSNSHLVDRSEGESSLTSCRRPVADTLHGESK